MTSRRQTAEIVALILLFGGITAFAVAGFARNWAPAVASRHGEGVDSVIQYLMITTGLVLVIGTVTFLAFLWLYGRGKPTAVPATNERSERRWAIIPVLSLALIAEVGVMVKGMPVWQKVYAAPPADALVVEVTAQQFEWLARYPGADGKFGRLDPRQIDAAANPVGIDSTDANGRDDFVTRNRIRAPVGKTVAIMLRGIDVLHSFSVPAFRVKQDVVPGMVNRISFIPSVTGTFEIACAELCGMAHYRMAARFLVMDSAEFDAWWAEQTGVKPWIE